jgi:hypothetical protein
VPKKNLPPIPRVKHTSKKAKGLESMVSVPKSLPFKEQIESNSVIDETEAPEPYVNVIFTNSEERC